MREQIAKGNEKTTKTLRELLRPSRGDEVDNIEFKVNPKTLEIKEIPLEENGKKKE